MTLKYKVKITQGFRVCYLPCLLENNASQEAASSQSLPVKTRILSLKYIAEL